MVVGLVGLYWYRTTRPITFVPGLAMVMGLVGLYWYRLLYQGWRWLWVYSSIDFCTGGGDGCGSIVV